jgi:hypothetical protein
MHVRLGARPRIQPRLVAIAQALMLQRLSNALVGIFIPLVIIQNGGPLWSVVGFYFVRSAVKFVLNFWVIKFIRSYGAHVGLGISFVFGGLQLASILGFARTHHLAFLVAGAVCFALIEAFNDNSRHLYISTAMEHASKSSSMATMELAGQIADFVGPLIGAVIGWLIGAEALLAVGLAVLGCSIFPLRKMGTLQVDQASRIRFSMAGAPGRDVVANFCFCADEAIGVLLWPIYLAVILESFGYIGAVATGSALVAMGAVYVAGNRGDKGQDRAVLREGATGMSIVNLFRIMASSAVPIALVGGCYAAAKSYMQNAWNATYYTHAKSSGLQYMVAMEIACDAAYLIVWSILLGISLLAEDAQIFFLVAFILSAVIIWGTLLLTRQNHHEQ